MEIYTVGGCVRDLLLGITPKDIDYIVVGATVEEMLRQGFEQVGADFPVFLHPISNDEYALARTERKTGTGYLGFVVNTDGISLEEDLGRRDLTINSMAMDDKGNIFDPFNGQVDLKNRVLKHTTDAFSEDPLRVIRLARFYARYSEFTVHPETAHLCKHLVKTHQLDHLSVERFWAELEKVDSELSMSRFFEFLFDIDAHLHVKFFRELFNKNDKETVLNITNSLHKSDTRLMSFIAQVTQGHGNTLQTAKKEIKTAALNYKLFLATDFKNAESVLNLLTKCGAFLQGNSDINLITVVFDSELHNKDLQLRTNIKVFVNSLKSVSSINAEAFMGKFEGKELGMAIKNARLRKVQYVIDLMAAYSEPDLK